ncbi:hypothetical protein ABT061_05715 [Streptosporangium sp. NPDC002544]|uniref:hypothetical protein n=1 Tax=Streptosporangium sp. NPDC002544 TaxID=3154538 RepID=UPI00332C1652
MLTSRPTIVVGEGGSIDRAPAVPEAIFAGRGGDEAVYVDKREGRRLYRMPSRISRDIS